MPYLCVVRILYTHNYISYACAYLASLYINKKSPIVIVEIGTKEEKNKILFVSNNCILTHFITSTQ